MQKKHKSLARDILNELLSSRGDIRLRHSLRDYLGDVDNLWKYNQALRYLQRRGQVELARKSNKLFVVLTKKGKLQGLLNRIESDSGETLDKDWDEKWRLVIWDIPEASSQQRNRIRYFLKDLGFYQLQKSVYVRPYALPASAVRYLNESGLSKFIRFLRVDKVDDERELLIHFKLRPRKYVN